MRLFEYQAKEIFLGNGILIPKSQTISNAADAEQVREEIGGKVVLKAQVLSSGRSRFGGICLVNPNEDVVYPASKILGLSVNKQKVTKILLEEAIKIKNEFIVKLEIDPIFGRPVLIASRFDIKKSLTNGMQASENRIRIPLDFVGGLFDFQKRKVAVALEISKEFWGKFFLVLNAMWKIFNNLDAVRIEINPLVINEHNQFLALGANIEVEDRALFRQSAILDKKEPIYITSIYKKAEKYGISIIPDEGNIGCITNSEPFGYALKEMISSSGGMPGVIQNIGDGAGKEKISAGIKILFNNEKIDCILIAIFGGLTHCDQIAKGILETFNSKKKVKPIICYLNGTNSQSGNDLLQQSGIPTNDSLTSAVIESVSLTKGRG